MATGLIQLGNWLLLAGALLFSLAAFNALRAGRQVRNAAYYAVRQEALGRTRRWAFLAAIAFLATSGMAIYLSNLPGPVSVASAPTPTPVVIAVPSRLLPTATILRLEGYAVSSVPNGQAAVEFVRTHPVDLIIVDLRMPGMDGLEVIQVVNQVSPETEVILLTAFGTTESAIQALRLRIHDYLLKPASPAQIIATVKKGLARRTVRTKSSNPTLVDSDETAAVFTLKDGTIVDLSRRQIKFKNKVDHLTPAEGRLLRILMENEGKVFSHRELVLLVQGYDTSQTL